MNSAFLVLKVVEGQRVLVIGNPEGLVGTVSDGIISAFRSGRRLIQITAPISPGSSGSPVLDETGQVIGMATLVSKEGENLNFAISTEAITDANQSGLARTTPAPTPGSSVAVATPTPTEQPPSDQVQANFYFTNAFSEGNQKHYKDAIRDYTEAIRAKPDFADAYANRGWNYLQLGLYEKAIIDLSEAIRLEPDSPSTYNAYLNRGNAYLYLKQYQNAVGDYTEVIRLKPDYAGVYYNLGNCYVNLGQYERALTDYTEAIQLTPDMGEAYYNRSYAYKMLGNMRAAYAELKKSKQLGFRGN